MPPSKSPLEEYADQVWDRLQKAKKFEQLDRIEAENESLTKSNQQLHLANETLTLENKGLRGRVEDLQCEKDHLSSEVFKLQTNLDEALKKQLNSEAEANQFKTKAEELEKELGATRGDLKRLRTSQAFTRFIVDPSVLGKEDLQLVIGTIRRDLLKPVEDSYRERLTGDLIAEGAWRLREWIGRGTEYLLNARVAHPDYACPQCRGTPGYDGEGALICTKCHLRRFVACPRCGANMKYNPQDNALHCSSCTLTWN